MSRDPNKYADEGSIAHALAAMCLKEGKPAAAYVGRVIRAEDYEHAGLSPSDAHRWIRCPGSHALESEAKAKFKPRRFSMQVTQEMAEGVQVYLDNVLNDATARDAEILVEQRVPIGHITGEEGAWGTADVVLLDHAAYTLEADDLKFGKGVEVLADDNEQLQMYLLGLLESLGEFGDWQMFRGKIHQPRIATLPSEDNWTREELLKFGAKVKAAADNARAIKLTYQGARDPTKMLHNDGLLVPGDKQCKFCKVKATCPAYAKHVTDATIEDFEAYVDAEVVPTPAILKPIPADAVALSRDLALIPLIRQWCDAREAHAESQMLHGHEIPNWKLVEGRKGNRSWVDEGEVEEVMKKSMRLPDDKMYVMKLISPTLAEKTVQPKQWKRLQEMVSQSGGKPTVVPVTDNRPALQITPPEDDFEKLENDENEST